MFDNRFKLHKYDEASINSVVLNVNQLEYFTYLELPNDIAKFLSLYCVQEFNTPKGPIELDYSDKITRECLRPWLKIETSIFNTEYGFHMYKFQFVDTRTTDVVSLYFAYNLQNSNPDKTSYIYMKGRNAEGFNPFEDGDGAGSASNTSGDSDNNSDDNTDDSSNCYGCCGKCKYCSK